MRHRPASFDATIVNPKSADGVGDLIHDEQHPKKGARAESIRGIGRFGEFLRYYSRVAA